MWGLLVAATALIQPAARVQFSALLTRRPGMVILAASAGDDGEACIRLDSGNLPDCVDEDTPGQWYACNEPPVDQANLQCFQPEDAPACDGDSNTPGLPDGKSWICIDTSNVASNAEGDDSY